MKAIPLIDLKALLHDIASSKHSERDKLKFACEEIGFFALVNHGISLEVMQDMRDMLQAYFAKPDAEKLQMEILPDNYRGYIPMATFTPNQDKGQSDLYEGYKLHAEIAADDAVCDACNLYGPNRWPSDFPAMQTVVTEYWQAMDGVSEKLIQAIAALLGLPTHVFLDMLEKPLTNMTLLHYPPHELVEPSSFGIHPHKDIDLFTLLYPDAVGGLELKTRAGEWMEATVPDDAIIVNAGDMLETLSGGRILSTPHRVINRRGKQRYSFPYFVVPRHDVVIEPLITPLPNFQWQAVSSGFISDEVWRTNKSDEAPSDSSLNLGSLQQKTS